MLQVGGDLDLFEKTLRAEIRRGLLAQHLDGHSALVFRVVGEVDVGHTAAADGLDDFVVTERLADQRNLGVFGERPARMATPSNAVLAATPNLLLRRRRPDSSAVPATVVIASCCLRAPRASS